MLKNIDKCGFYKKFDGKIQFSPKISNPKSAVKKVVGTVVTASQLTEEKEENKKSNTVFNPSTNKKKYKTESAFAT